MNLADLKRIDWWLFGTISFLLTFSVLLIYSINKETGLGPFWKHLFLVFLGIILFFLTSFFDYRWLRSVAFILYITGIVLLVLLLFFGTTIRGTTGWFRLGGLSFQPVELVKLFFVIFLSYYFGRIGQNFFSIKNILLSAVSVSLVIGLVALQPDFGSAIVFLLLWLCFLLLVRTKRLYLITVFTSLIFIFLVSWFFIFAPYQKERILNFFNPGRDPLGSGYQITQAKIAIGSGQWWGRGLGLGPQSQLRFLPEGEADFIFAVLAEELGFLGASILLFLYAFLFWRLWRVVRSVRDNFSLFLGLGILLLLFIEVIINIGMNLGLMPLTGLPLPLLSSGGSSLLTTMLALGLMQSLCLRQIK